MSEEKINVEEMNEEKIQVESLDVVVFMINGRPCYEIKYKEIGNDYYNIGYSSYNLDFVLEWKEKYFEVLENKAAKDTAVSGKWIPCSERLPEESDYYMACVYDEEANDYDYRKNWFAHKDDYSIEESEWRELLPAEKVTAWMPLPEPYKENDDERS